MASTCLRGLGRLAPAAFGRLADLLVGDLPATEPDDDRLLASFADYAASLPRLNRTGLVWGLVALELAPVLLGRGRFSRLADGERVRVLGFLERSRWYPLRAFCLAMKSAAIMVCFDDPSVEGAIGYTHECLLSEQFLSGTATNMP